MDYFFLTRFLKIACHLDNRLLILIRRLIIFDV